MTRRLVPGPKSVTGDAFQQRRALMRAAGVGAYVRPKYAPTPSVGNKQAISCGRRRAPVTLAPVRGLEEPQDVPE